MASASQRRGAGACSGEAAARLSLAAAGWLASPPWQELAAGWGGAAEGSSRAWLCQLVVGQADKQDDARGARASERTSRDY